MRKRIVEELPGNSITGRKSAYVTRNRQRIITSAIEVAGELGSGATIEAVSAKAEIAVSTIYKHFPDRDSLFEACLVSAMRDWESWALQQVSPTDVELTKLVKPLRIFFRLRTTHPQYAKLISSQPGNVFGAMAEIVQVFNAQIVDLSDRGELMMENRDVRVRNFIGCIFQIAQYQFTNPKSPDSDADLALEIALGLIGVIPSKAKKLVNGNLNVPSS